MADETSPPLQAAANRIRETAKWLTVALAGLGTVLVAGSQLSSLGSLDPGSTRFTAAVVGAVLAGLGAMIILAATAMTAATPAVGLMTMTTTSPKGVETIVKDPTLLQGHSDLAELRTAYTDALSKRKAAMDDYYDHVDDDAKKDAAKLADAQATRLNAVVLALVGAASYANLAYRWRRATLATGIGTVIAGAGIGVFAWAANPPEDAAASVATPGVLASPKTQYLKLTTAGIEALGSALGKDCDTAESLSVLVLGSTASGPDVMVTQDGCNPVRLAVTHEWGPVSSRRT